MWWLLLGAAMGGFLGGLYAAHESIARCQDECAMGGMVCSPRLHQGLDYCVFASDRPR